MREHGGMTDRDETRGAAPPSVSDSIRWVTGMT